MSLHFKVTETEVQFVGHSFPHKEAIKALGARFDSVRKIWVLKKSIADLDAVAKLCRLHGGSQLQDTSITETKNETYASPRTVASSGAFLSKLDIAQANHLPVSQNIANTHLDSNNQNFPAETVDKEKTYKLSEISDLAALAVARKFPDPLWVEAEIEAFTPRPAGLYLSLAEPVDRSSSLGTSSRSKGSTMSAASFSIKATMWRSVVDSLKKKYGPDFDRVVAENTRVRFLVQVQLYRDRGQLSLNIIDFDLRYTQGELALLRAKIIAELKRLGLFDRNRGTSLPIWPLSIGLITAKGSRAESDFLHQLEQFQYRGRVVISYATMQGEKTATEVISSLDGLSAQNLDLVVITRGGGGSADLRWFDDLQLAKTIAAYPIPVISAIGHHEDTCVTEMVSYAREKTPTGAADFIISLQSQADLRLQNLVLRLEDRTRKIVDGFSQHLLQLERRTKDYATLRCEMARETLSKFMLRIHAQSMKVLTELDRQYTARSVLLYQASSRFLAQFENQIQLRERMLVQKDPQPWMASGWTQIWKSSGDSTKILSGAEVSRGQRVKARLIDSILELEVVEIETAQISNDKGKKP